MTPYTANPSALRAPPLSLTRRGGLATIFKPPPALIGGVSRSDEGVMQVTEGRFGVTAYGNAVTVRGIWVSRLSTVGKTF